MRHSKQTTITVLAASTLLLLVQSLYAQSKATNRKNAPIEVSVDEIGKNLILIGRLKKPLGTLLTVRGKWSYPHSRVKDYSLRFTVTHLDGQKLRDPIEYNVSQLMVVTKDGSPAIPPRKRHEQLVGVEWTLRAYETGFLHIVSPEAFQNDPVPGGLPYYFDTFTSEINGVLQL